jgi:O-antigen/teichoic acid export membrane protein
MLLNLLNSVYASQIGAVNRPDLSAKLTLLSLVVNVGLLAIFIPTSLFKIKVLGMAETGAAMADMLGVMVLFITTRFIVMKLTKTRSNSRILIHVLAALITGFVLIGMSSIWIMTHWFDLIAYGLISACVFAVLLYILKELTIGDLKFFLSVVDPREMKDYISSELRRK